MSAIGMMRHVASEKHSQSRDNKYAKRILQTTLTIEKITNDSRYTRMWLRAHMAEHMRLGIPFSHEGS